jgi:heterodisulfide reductase subunit A
VLSVGMEISDSVRLLGQRLDIDLDENGFSQTSGFNPIETSRPGIYAVGPFREPKDIPESVIEASGAAAAAATNLSPARFSLSTSPEYPPERQVFAEEPRIGVFVCHCGSNIAGFLNVSEVTDYASALPYVVHAENNLYTCSQDSIKHITEAVMTHNLNRVVVASCSPLTHAPLFQDSIRFAGLNPYLFEMANIRNQCSWVHSSDNKVATQKAKELVGMATARTTYLQPLDTISVPVYNHALVLGGGPAGMTAAYTLAEQGFPVHLVEKENELGGNLRYVYIGAPTDTETGHEKDPQYILATLIGRVNENKNIKIHLDSKVISTSGFKGNFTSIIEDRAGKLIEVNHGATILATGAQEYRGSEYGYGSDPRVLTQMEFESLLAEYPANRKQLPDTIVMFQCVGPAEHYCARICCTTALKNALAFKKRNPEGQVIILFKDIRVYGFKERLYNQVREHGVIFLRYEDEHRPKVDLGNSIENKISVLAWDTALQRDVLIHPDLLVLSMPVVPNPDVHSLSAQFKVPVDADGFFLEAHVKLRPVDFTTDGIFMAGMAHYPKLLDETMIQAQAAAARAARILSRETLTAGGRVAVVDENMCTGCLTCVRVCPFEAPRIQSNLTGTGNIAGAAYIETAICQGCGICAAECPARAIQLMHYTDQQMAAKVNALAMASPVYKPVVDLVGSED